MKTQKEFESILRKARKTNERRNQLERNVGFASPRDLPLGDQLRTVYFAIECGIKTEDWDCVAEGLAMLIETLPDPKPA